jgi:hypothetical protein
MELTRKFPLGRTVGAVSLRSERDETESLRERETLRDWGKLLDWIVWLLYKIKLLFYTANLVRARPPSCAPRRRVLRLHVAAALSDPRLVPGGHNSSASAGIVRRGSAAR